MFTVRPAAPDDAAAVAALHVRSWRHTYAGIVPDQVLDHLATTVDQRAERYRRQWADPASPFRCLVVTEGEHVLGFVLYGPYRLAEQQLDQSVGEVLAIYLDPPHLGRGAGRTLLDAAVTALRAQGFSEVRLWVMEENTRARRFYERYGFTPDGTHHLFRLTAPDGSETAIPEVRYALPLRSDQRPAPTTGVESHSGA
ncbi:MAG TPA: GNAT family N-acetyltransferase [Natronosporangium sp.]|nr:GNAT family N-acetyltransferase [Natronosporangium sp.]